MQEEQITNIGKLIEPEPIGFSFDAPGWTILLGIIIFILIILAYKKFQEYQKNKYRRFAISSIKSLTSPEFTMEEIIFKISEILKRVSITSYGRNEIASLNGKDWLEFVSQKNKNKSFFQKKSKAILTGLLYQGKYAEINNDDIQNYKKDSLNWIKKHHV